MFLNIQEELRKQQRKDFRKEKKLKVHNESEEGVDPDVAAMMGFSGFGSTKK
jgi:U4/U6.U5 tri-snRNP component SNU23